MVSPSGCVSCIVLRHRNETVSPTTCSSMQDNHDNIITGDFNFHLDIRTEPDVRPFHETLADRGKTQLVTGPAHKMGHTLDVVIVRDSTSMIMPIRPSVYYPCLCDTYGNPSGGYMAITFSVNASKPTRARKKDNISTNASDMRFSFRPRYYPVAGSEH